MFHRFHLKDRLDVGLYRHIAYSSIYSYLCNRKVHLLPTSDGLLKERVGANFIPYYFGFDGVEQVKKWIHKPEWFSELAKCDIVVSIIDAPFITATAQAVMLKEFVKEENVVRCFSPEEFVCKI